MNFRKAILFLLSAAVFGHAYGNASAFTLGTKESVIESCEKKLATRAKAWGVNKYTPFAEREDVKQADGYFATVAACDKAKAELFPTTSNKAKATGKKRETSACAETVELIGGLMGLGALEAPRRQHSRNYYYNDTAWATATQSAKRALAAGVLKYHQCTVEPSALTVRIYGLYSGKKLAKYGSHSGLKIP